jgi:hypothetical protein
MLRLEGCRRVDDVLDWRHACGPLATKPRAQIDRIREMR